MVFRLDHAIANDSNLFLSKVVIAEKTMESSRENIQSPLSFWLQKYTRRWGEMFFCLGAIGIIAFSILTFSSSSRESLDNIQTLVYEKFNDIMGRNMAWDWFIIIAASHFWSLVSFIAILFIAAHETWCMRQMDYGQGFGYLISALILTFLTMIAANLTGLIMPERALDEVAAGGTCLFVLLLMRLPIAGIVAALLLSIHLIAQLMSGSLWIIYMLFSQYIGMLIASFFLLLGGKINHWFERKFSEVFTQHCWRHTVPNQLVCEPIILQEHDSLFNTGLQNFPSKERKWNSVIEKYVLPILCGADDKSYSISPAPPAGFMSDFQGSPKVRFLTLDNKEVFVIRCLWRRGGFLGQSEKFGRYFDSAKINLLFERLGVPAPRVYWAQQISQPWRMKSICFVIEEFIRGRNMDSNSLDELKQAARLLADMHSHTFEEWGDIFNVSGRCKALYLSYSREEILYLLKMISNRIKCGFSLEETMRIWKLFEAEAAKLLSYHETKFRLIHGDVHARNFLVGENREMKVVDFATVSRDFAAWEIIKCAVTFSRPHPEFCSSIWNAYFERAGMERWREFLEQARLGVAYFALRELAHKRIPLQASTGEKAQKEVMRRIEDLFEIKPEFWGNNPAETKWDELFKILRKSSASGQ